MEDCLRGLRELGCEIIIISDSNTIFIDHILRENHMLDLFDEVFTNPAHWDEQQPNLLHVKPFHHNEDCLLSGKNLCKGKVLQNYIAK
jgi:pyridoxal phosphate phosphatase PHOSPHO2